MLEVQKFLREGGTVDELLTRYAIKARRHALHPSLVLLKYNQIDSDFSEPIVRECRGIVLDESDDWRVVSRAFDKFFNHGECHAAPIDWNTARVQEKVDGSLCVLYWYKGWHVATTGTPDGCGDVHLSGKRFSDLFWEAFAATGAQTPDARAGSRCYFFELTSPYNRIVVPHIGTSITLLGARNLESGEISADEAEHDFEANICVARESTDLSSFTDLEASFGSINPLEQEGYVVVDAAFNRVKVKHPGYVALHRAKEGFTLKNFVEIARSGEVSEAVVAFPEFEPMLLDAKTRVEKFVSYLEGAYDAIKDIEVQKDFALRATKTRCSAPLFQVRAKKADSVRQAVALMRIDSLMENLSVG